MVSHTPQNACIWSNVEPLSQKWLYKKKYFQVKKNLISCQKYGKEPKVIGQGAVSSSLKTLISNPLMKT